MTFYTLCRDLYGRTIGFYVDSVSIGDAFDVAAEQKGVALVIAAQFVNQNVLLETRMH
jgi:hypothetical protein